MLDGLYKVEFKTPIGAGSGVVHVVGGRMWGGDAGLYYVGTYQTNGNKVSAAVTTNRHTNYPHIASVFGVDRVSISLDGTVNGNVVSCTGKAPQAPNISFSAVLTKVSD